MRQRSRSVHRLLRFPEGKEFCPDVDGAGAPGASPEHPERQLFELRRADRFDIDVGVHALRITDIDPGYETAATAAGAAPGSGADQTGRPGASVRARSR